MSMSTHVVGFRPPDEKWKEMKAVWDSCVAANINAPDVVHKFFDYRAPDDAGVEIDLDSAVKEFDKKGVSGFDVILSKLPESIDRIRFYNSW